MIEASVGVLFADPTSTAPSPFGVDLMPGRDYGVLCIFRDSTKAPRHSEMGMYSVIHVTGKPAASPPMTVDSVVAVDYAFAKYPRRVRRASMHSSFETPASTGMRSTCRF